MVVCVECKKEMVCVENGLGVRYGNSHVYAGDKYQCKKCLKEIIYTNNSSIHDPDHQVKTIKMNEIEG